MNELPEVDSVWGVLDDTQTWRCVLDTRESGSRIIWSGFYDKAATSTQLEAWLNWISGNDQFDTREKVDIRAIVSGGEGAADDVWNEVIEALQPAWPNETLHWNESPRELITRLINERDDKAIESGKGLPELTDAQRERMNAMPANLVEKLWNKVVVPAIANTASVDTTPTPKQIADSLADHFTSTGQMGGDK